MFLSSITQRNLEQFSHLLSSEALAELSREGCYGIGAIAEEQGAQYAAGTLVFYVGEELSDGAARMAALLKWLFVDESARGRGVADALMAELVRILGLSGVDCAVCEVPMAEEYDPLCTYLESIGFDFSLEDIPVLDAELAELYENRAFAKPPNENECIPLSRLSEEQFAKLLQWIRTRPDCPPDLPQRRSDYEPDVSCVCVKKPAALLVSRVPDLGLQLRYFGPLLARTDSLARLSLYAVHAARRRYPPETILRIDCRTPAGTVILDRVFREPQPTWIRYGRLDLFQLFEEGS